MMMQMLSAGGMEVLTDDVREADSDNEKGYFEFEPVKATKRDSAWVSLAVGKAVKAIYTFLADLPAEFEYRVIFMRRNLQEVIRSQRVMLERRGEKGAAVGPEKLAEIFERQLERTDHWLNQQKNLRYLDVEFAKVLDDPDSMTVEISRFLDIPLDTSAMAEVVSASLYHQRGSTPDSPPR